MPAFAPVPPAHGPVITDRLLDHLTRLAHDAHHGLTSEAEAEWLLAAAPAVFEECRRWRAFGAAHHIPADAVNVIHLPAARR